MDHLLSASLDVSRLLPIERHRHQQGLLTRDNLARNGENGKHFLWPAFLAGCRDGLFVTIQDLGQMWSGLNGNGRNGRNGRAKKKGEVSKHEKHQISRHFDHSSLKCPCGSHDRLARTQIRHWNSPVCAAGDEDMRDQQESSLASLRDHKVGADNSLT